MKTKALLTVLMISSSIQLASAQGLSIPWQKVYGGNNAEILTSIRSTNDNGAILGGSSLEPGAYLFNIIFKD